MNTELKNTKKSSKITPEELKNQLICGIIEMTNEERQELLALWKELKYHDAQRANDICQPEYRAPNRI